MWCGWKRILQQDNTGEGGVGEHVHGPGVQSGESDWDGHIQGRSGVKPEILSHSDTLVQIPFLIDDMPVHSPRMRMPDWAGISFCR